MHTWYGQVRGGMFKKAGVRSLPAAREHNARMIEDVVRSQVKRKLGQTCIVINATPRAYTVEYDIGRHRSFNIYRVYTYSTQVNDRAGPIHPRGAASRPPHG